MPPPQDLARTLYEHRAAHRPFADIPVAEFPAGREEAYEVQDVLIGLYLQNGQGPIGGWKIALTNPAMQESFGVDEPAEGAILAPLIRRNDAAVRAADYGRVGAEGEIALRLRKGIAPGDGPFDEDSVADAVGGVMPALEIIDDRGTGTDVSLGMLVCDNAMNYGCVLGPEVPFRPGMDLGALEGRLQVNGGDAGEGRGVNAYGGPLRALAWLADSLARRGRPLEADDIVMTGSIAFPVWLSAGDTVRWTVAGLGEAGLRIEG